MLERARAPIGPLRLAALAPDGSKSPNADEIDACNLTRRGWCPFVKTLGALRNGHERTQITRIVGDARLFYRKDWPSSPDGIGLPSAANALGITSTVRFGVP